MVGVPVGSLLMEGAVVTGDSVGMPVTGAAEGEDVETGARDGLEVGPPAGVGAIVGSAVSSTRFATQESTVDKIWHCPSHSPPKKHPEPAFSLNTLLPGAPQNVDSTSLSTKLSVPVYSDSWSTNNTNVVAESLKQLCWNDMTESKKANA